MRRLVSSVLLLCALTLQTAGAAPMPSPAAAPGAASLPSPAPAPGAAPWQLNARREYEAERTITYPRLVRGNPYRREVALTFDDGPYAELTPRILDILQRNHVPATFFVIGKNVEAHPDIVQREATQGDEVANHTYDHQRLPQLTRAQIQAELHQDGLAIEKATGEPVRLFRPPGGEYDATVLDVARRLGYVMVLWTDDPGDFKTPQPAVIESRVLRDVSNGSIILLHEKIPQTADMLDDLIHHLKARGYRFVTCSEMARESGAIDVGGPVVPVQHRVAMVHPPLLPARR